MLVLHNLVLIGPSVSPVLSPNSIAAIEVTNFVADVKLNVEDDDTPGSASGGMLS